MLVQYIKDMPICYNGYTQTDEKKGNIVDIKDMTLVEALILSKSVVKYKEPVVVSASVPKYDNKMLKTVKLKKANPRKKK
jgi:hypothetical protein